MVYDLPGPNERSSLSLHTFFIWYHDSLVLHCLICHGKFLTLFLVVWLWYTALNEALKKEVERLKIATGEIMTPTDTYHLGMHNIPYTQSTFFPLQPQPGTVDTQNMRVPQFHPFQSNMSTPHQRIASSHLHTFSEMLPHDPLGRLQGLDISSRSSLLVKSEGPSISASESSSI